jgi:putative Ca2+/H+ antiporter (TMEM165/GDT1 family)
MRAALGARPAAIGQQQQQQRRQAGGAAGSGGAAKTRRPRHQQHLLLLSARARQTSLPATRAAAIASAPKPNAGPTTTGRRPSTAARASSAAGAGDGQNAADAASAAAEAAGKAAQLRLALGAMALSLAALGAGLYYTASAGFTAPASAAALKAAVAHSPLGRSGLLPAFSLIFLSEVGDKTFFIAALLAAKLGRAVAFFGSMAALATMTAVSVLIGAACSRVPEALTSSLPVGEVAGTVLLVVFGVRALREAMRAPEDGASAVEEELADAREVVEGAAAAAAAAPGGGASGAAAAAAAAPAAAAASSSSAKAGAGGADKAATLGARLFEVATLIFLAEWGDRSMLATVALGAAQSPWAVAVGATAGHAAATAIAVVGGALAGARVSERAINATSGVLFLLFAAATLFTAF